MSAGENIYVGSKPVMNYVTALVTALQKTDKVNVLARGRAISTAVDAVEVTRRSFLPDIVVEDITIGTQVLEEADNKRNVSTITITLSCKKQE